ncbi:possible lysine-specific histone demethylase 1-like [Coccinella septempunctata]|uniref:possible lysine-specific histone demethylase 1-like n=1 Tax=Coccinella septempunctata TaxID=41139 RepID=UPI001D061A81|nr:possible lysine-specific histone demethylase 1-like [Coccinella septempunctata]
MAKYCIIFLLFACLFARVTQAKIVIVGAGASGIAAAAKLIEKNITDFIILEAQERPGGRIQSIFLLDGEEGGNVDLGAEYVVGEEGNVVYEFAKDDLKHFDKTKKSKAYYSDGTSVDQEVLTDISEFKEGLKQLYEGKKPISVAEAFKEKFKDSILKKYVDTPAKSKQAMDLLRVCEKSYLYRQATFDWSKLLLNDHYKLSKGDQMMNWNGKGYKHFLDLLMRKFGDEHRLRLFPIYYYSTVDSINWGSDGKVQLLTKEGQNYEADHVIFTPSAGVLKEKHEKLFTPKLPAKKVDAIKDIGFEAVMKVVLQYGQKWWDDDVFELVFVFNAEDEKLLTEEYKVGHQKDGKTWLTSFYKLMTAPGLPNTLIAWFSGPMVPEVEKLDMQTIKEGIVLLTKKFLGKQYNVTTPQIVIPSTWYSNPNFRGVCSHETLASGNRKTQVQKDIAEPLLNNANIPVVLFAGEHTHETHYGTVHGAVESGYRAADELAKHIHKI